MDLFEIIGDAMNPGSVGSIEKNNEIQKEINIKILFIKSAISIGIAVGLFFLIFRDGVHIEGIVFYLGGMFIYCVMSYFIIPKPDYSNIGWLGGLMDHPFKYSDDLNRMLIFLSGVLYPGRFIATTVMSWARLLKK